jgi:hypothetical protein
MTRIAGWMRYTLRTGFQSISDVDSLLRSSTHFCDKPAGADHCHLRKTPTWPTVILVDTHGTKRLTSEPSMSDTGVAATWPATALSTIRSTCPVCTERQLFSPFTGGTALTGGTTKRRCKHALHNLQATLRREAMWLGELPSPLHVPPSATGHINVACTPGIACAIVSNRQGTLL